MNRRITSLTIVIVLLLTGCSNSPVDYLNSYNKKMVSIKEELASRQQSAAEVVQEYEKDTDLDDLQMDIKRSKPRVMIDGIGYEPANSKNALFIADNLGKSFRVVDTKTNQIVYEGEIDSFDNISRGDFSDVTTPGEYFIETDIIGCSDIFKVEEDKNKKIFSNVINIGIDNDYEITTKNVIDVAKTIHILLLSLKCHGKSYEKIENNDFVTKILKMSEWMLECQDARTGSVLEDYEATASFCAASMLCAVNLGKYENNYSQNYRNAAIRAWKWMEKHKERTEFASMPVTFYAASALYSETQSQEYQRIIEEYISKYSDLVVEDIYTFLGATIYLDTNKRVNRDLCTSMMQKLVKETENICVTCKKNGTYIYSEDINENLSKLLLICFIDYVTPSEEYAVVLENMLHYMLGRNQEGIRIIDDNYKITPIDSEKKLLWDAILVYMLSDLAEDK